MLTYSHTINKCALRVNKCVEVIALDECTMWRQYKVYRADYISMCIIAEDSTNHLYESWIGID